MPKLLVVTPFPRPKRLHQKWIDRAIPFRRGHLHPADLPPFGGHFAVTRSLQTGLAKLGADWAPASDLDRAEAEVVVVLAGAECLRQAIEMKRLGRCARLFAGPNVSVRPTDEDGLLLRPEIDGVIVPSNHVRELYVREAPSLHGRILVWAAGVDPDYWRPADRTRDTALIYVKSHRESVRRLKRLASNYADRVALLRYGWHTMPEYRQALDRAQCCIFLTAKESQGIALAEAWAMDVPTYVTRSPDAQFDAVRSAPYLTEATGRLWSNEGELAALLAAPPATAPRTWVLRNMTDEICASRLLSAIGL
jgi:glycosyltransferase involved in cell wall biosynthesis